MTRHAYRFFRFRTYKGQQGLSQQYSKWHIERETLRPGHLVAACGKSVELSRQGTEVTDLTFNPMPLGAGICRQCLLARSSLWRRR
jgi:hypothetical protein